MLRILPLILALSGLLPAGALGGWYCEGRQCGKTPSICCCQEPAEGGLCDKPSQEASENRSSEGVCLADCGCIMVSAERPQAGTVRAASSAETQDTGSAILPETSLASVPDYCLTRSLETRGPPLIVRSNSPSSLRAPPIS